MQIDTLLSSVASFVWGPWLIVLLFGTHLYLTFRTGLIQKHLWHAIKLSVTKEPGAPGDVSAFGSLTTALAATIGTGNIYGVAGAILLGGPGAVLWMWLTGVFGIATKYAEALLSVKYREINVHGQMSGGPMYVLEKALHARWAGVLFAVFTAIAAFGIGNMAQSNAIADMLVAKKLDLFLNYPDSTIKLWAGLILSFATGLVILGGIQSISKFCQVLVPLMAFFYVVGCLILLGSNWEKIPSTLSLIISSAFTGQAAVGGFVGAGIAEAMRFGIARGLFSNESGLGSAPIVAAAAQTKDPVRQALVSSTGTFWDTVVVCAMTGLVIVSSGHWSEANLTKATLCQISFQQLGHFGSLILIGGLLTFVFSTIIGWGYYGEKALEYLFGIRAILPYRWLWIIMVFLGAVWKSENVWNLSDIMNGLMALPNIASLLLLGGVVANETNRYFASRSKSSQSPSD